MEGCTPDPWAWHSHDVTRIVHNTAPTGAEAGPGWSAHFTHPPALRRVG